MGGTRGKLSPKNNDDIQKEPITLNFNKTAFALKNEECIREALKRNLPASILIVQTKQKDLVSGLISIMQNYYEVQGPIPGA